MKNEKEIIDILIKILEKQTQAMEESNKILTEILKSQMDRTVIPLVSSMVIPYNDSKETTMIENKLFGRARVFINVMFSEGQTSGVSVDLWFKNTKIGEVLRIKPSHANLGGASQTFDIAQLNGFHFVFVNHDSSKNATIKTFDIVMFNEK